MQTPRLFRAPDVPFDAFGPTSAARRSAARRPAFYILTALLFGAAIAGGCASTRPAAHPAVGTWAYTITGTDLGDVTGTLDLTMLQNTMAGQLHIEQLDQTVPIDAVHTEGDSLTFDATIQYQGQPLNSRVNLQIEGDALAGTLAIPAYTLQYPISGMRRGR